MGFILETRVQPSSSSSGLIVAEVWQVRQLVETAVSRLEKGCPMYLVDRVDEVAMFSANENADEVAMPKRTPALISNILVDVLLVESGLVGQERSGIGRDSPVL